MPAPYCRGIALLKPEVSTRYGRLVETRARSARSLARSLVPKIILSRSTKLRPGVYDAAIKRTTNCFSAATRPATKFDGETRVVYHDRHPHRSYAKHELSLRKRPPQSLSPRKMSASRSFSALSRSGARRHLNSLTRRFARARARVRQAPRERKIIRGITSETSRFITQEILRSQTSNLPNISPLLASVNHRQYRRDDPCTMRALFALRVWQ